MRILIYAIGSRGDIQPFVALGRSLSAVGHQVRIASHRPYASFIKTSGLAFSPITGNPQELLQGELAKNWLESGRNPVRFVRRFVKLSNEYINQYLEDSYQASQDADAILYSTLGVAAYHLAEHHRIPCISVPLQPFTRTRTFPTIFIPASLRLGGTFNWTTHLIIEQLLWQPFRQQINRWRIEKLRLPPFPFTGPLPMIYRGFLPTLYGISAHVFPKPQDYPIYHHITGYWFLKHQNNWTPPPGLEKFLATDPPPIYFGFGSMTTKDPERFSKILIAALKNTGQRGVILTGWGNLEVDQSDRDLFTINAAPHEWLFPRMRAIIHHGGAGTTAAGFRAGTPMLVIPFFGDQPFWGDRVAALGVGPRPIRQQKLNVTGLTAAIEHILEDADMFTKARTLSEKIKSECGVDQAVSLIEQYIALPELIPQFL